MTKIGEETVLTSECASKLFRLPVASGGDFIYVNTGSNSISSIVANDQKLVQTWTLTHPNTFTCPVAFSHEDDTICCISDDNTLLTWADTTPSLKKATKVKLPSKVFALLSPPGSGCYAVFTSGAVLPVKEILSSPQLVASVSVPGLDGDLVWADILLDSRCQEIILVFVTVKETEYKLWGFRLVQDNWSLDPICLHGLSKENQKLQSWCAGWSTNTPVFIAAWSDGQIESYPLEGSQPTILFNVLNVEENSFLAVETLDKSHLAVVNRNHSKGKGTIMEVWDLKYGTQKAVKTVTHALSKNFQMKAVGSKLYVSIDSGVITIPVELEESTLFAVVGKTTEDQKSTIYEWGVEGELQEIKEDESPESSEAPKPMDCFSMSLDSLNEKLHNFSSEETREFCSRLARQRDVSEKDLIRLVQFALRRSKGLEFTKLDDDEALVENDDFLLLCSLFSVKFSDIFLRHNLKVLTSEETMLSLQFLLFLMNKKAFVAEDDSVPDDLQVANWVQLLIESHFEDLLMSNDLEIFVLLKQLRNCVIDKLEVYEELNEISHLLKFSKRKNLLPENYTEAEYSVDIIKY